MEAAITEIKRAKVSGVDILYFKGKLDEDTSPKLQETLLEVIPSSEKVTLDFSEISYISSAGLRVLLLSKKYATSLGKTLTLTNVSTEVMKVFEVTNYLDILTIN